MLYVGFPDRNLPGEISIEGKLEQALKFNQLTPSGRDRLGNVLGGLAAKLFDDKIPLKKKV